MSSPDFADEEFVSLMIGSHQRLVGVPLVDSAVPPAQIADWLYHDAPFGLLAHGLGADPVFRYANRTAQHHFGYSWAEFVGLPSRFSAAPSDREERARLLADVTRDGYSTGYRGLRIAKSGAQFWVDDTTVWNLIDPHGELHGQAALIRTVKPA